MNLQTARRRLVLTDFVFGEPIPVPEVQEENSAEAWLKWLHAVAAMERLVAFSPIAVSPLT